MGHLYAICLIALAAVAHLGAAKKPGKEPTARQDLLAAAARGDSDGVRSHAAKATASATPSTTDEDIHMPAHEMYGEPATLCRALLVASRLGHPSAVSTLLEIGATPNCGDVLPSKQFWRVLAGRRDVDLGDVLKSVFKLVSLRGGLLA